MENFEREYFTKVGELKSLLNDFKDDMPFLHEWFEIPYVDIRDDGLIIYYENRYEDEYEDPYTDY